MEEGAEGIFRGREEGSMALPLPLAEVTLTLSLIWDVDGWDFSAIHNGQCHLPKVSREDHNIESAHLEEV